MCFFRIRGVAGGLSREAKYVTVARASTVAFQLRGRSGIVKPTEAPDATGPRPRELPVWARWLAPAFVVASLAGLLLAPLLLQARRAELRRDIEELAAPARDLVDAVQLALAQEVAAERGYLLTGEVRYLERYERAHDAAEGALADLTSLAGVALGTEVQRRLAELRLAQENWHHANAALVTGRASSEQFLLEFPRNQLLYEEALSAAVRLGDAIGLITRERLAQLRAAERLGFFVTVILAAVALLSGAVVLRIGFESRRLAAENVRRAEAEQRLRTRAEAAVRARDEVLAVVSHDLRNPLGTILMTADLLLLQDLERGEQTSKVAILKRSAERMNRLIQDLLDVARLEAGHGIALEPQPEDAVELVQDVLEMHRPHAERRSVTLELRLATVPRVLADRDRIFQVLSNLLGNAIKFTEEGGRVMVATQEEANRVRFSVADTGRGIPADEFGRIFEPYWQAGGHRRLGAGRGLAFV